MRQGEVSVRAATAHDAEVLGRLRAALRAELGPVPAQEFDAFVNRCIRHFRVELARPDPVLRAWVACDGSVIVGTSVLMILPTLPRLGSSGHYDGRIRDVYVRPSHRRRGIARALMHAALVESRALNIDRLSLGSSPMGRPLYESLGFVPKVDEMVYEPHASR